MTRSTKTKQSLFKFAFVLLTGISAAAIPVTAQAQSIPPGKELVNDKVIKDIRSFVDTEIVRLSTQNQNIKYGDLSQDAILELDTQWRAETKSTDQPLISATLSNPLSSYLTRVQAHSEGLYTEMFVMDKNGLNVGQSNISSDYWQGDEAKFQKTYPNGATAIFVDEPEFNDAIGVWVTQANLSIGNNEGKVIGAITVEINLSELERRNAFKTN